jgi:NAD(P)-dependent dehydrogenase (short-subunit alcohol dehydrogenase family)
MPGDGKGLEEIYARGRGETPDSPHQALAAKSLVELLDLRGRVAIVTAGGGVGLGRATALKLAQLGAAVAVADINGDGAESTASAVRELGAQAMGIQCDVSKSEPVDAMVTQVLRRFGRVDILVNNLGWNIEREFATYAAKDMDRIVARTLMCTLYCCRAVLDGMIERREGWIVNIASEAGKIPIYRETIYTAGKHGVVGFTKALALEVGKHNIHVNCVCPGVMLHPGLQALVDDPKLYPEARESVLNAIARTVYGRPGYPEEVANMIAYLCSPAANYIAGQAISVGGGLSLSL